MSSPPTPDRDKHLLGVTVVLSLGLLGVFASVVIAAIATVNDPPLQADAAPTVSAAATGASSEAAATTAAPDPAQPSPFDTEDEGPPDPTDEAVPGQTTDSEASVTPAASVAAATMPTAASTGSPQPPQARGAFDPHSRLLAVAAIVVPLLTTVVGFYFGQRVGEAGKAQLALNANEQLNDIEQTLASRPSAQPGDLLNELRQRNLLTLRRR